MSSFNSDDVISEINKVVEHVMKDENYTEPVVSSIKCQSKKGGLINKIVRHDEAYIIFNMQALIIKWRLFVSDLKDYQDKTLIDFFTEIDFIDDFNEFNKNKEGLERYLEHLYKLSDVEFFKKCLLLLNVRQHFLYIRELLQLAINKFEKESDNFDVEKCKKLRKNISKTLETVEKIDVSNFIKHLDNTTSNVDEDNIYVIRLQKDPQNKHMSKIELIDKIFNRLKEDMFNQIVEYNKHFLHALKEIVNLSNLLQDFHKKE